MATSASQFLKPRGRRFKRTNGDIGDDGEDTEEDEMAEGTDRRMRPRTNDEEILHELRHNPTSQKRMIALLGSAARLLALNRLLFFMSIIFVIALIVMALTNTLFPFWPTVAFGTVYFVPHLLVPWVFPMFGYVAPRSRVLPYIILAMACLYAALTIVILITSIYEIAFVYPPGGVYSTPFAVGAVAALVIGAIYIVLTGAAVFFAVVYLPEAEQRGPTRSYAMTRL